MALLTIALSGNNAAKLKATVDGFFATNLDIRIYNLAFLARDQAAILGRELVASILYDNEGEALDDPYEAHLFIGGSTPVLTTKMQEWLTANPDAFAQGPFIDDLSERRRTSDLTSVLVTNPSFEQGSQNWLANNTGFPSQAANLNVETSDNKQLLASDNLVVQTGDGINTFLPEFPLDGQTLHIKNISALPTTIDPVSRTIDDVAAPLALAVNQSVMIVYREPTNDWITFHGN